MVDEPRGAGAPTQEDERHDDLEFNPQLEPRKALAWLNLLEESEDAFEPWNLHCDNLDKLYANMSRLALRSRDKEFAMFWANCEVIKPSIYAKAPVPAIVPKFKDRRPVYQAASELMERCTTVAFDLTCINELMMLVRDDVALIGRGVAWCRYEGAGDDYEYEKVCIDFKHRRDFLHSVSRNWREVTWVAAASYMTRAQARERFRRYSGDAYQEAEYEVDRDSKTIGGADNRERAKFWEIWDKDNRRVVWVAKGCELILDEDKAHLKLEGFFPCPKPAYGTLQRGSLVPVPDAMQYRDQLDEINLLTSKIHALSDGLEVKGFFPAGGGEMADAIETAIKLKTPGRVMVPIKNWASFGGTKDVIIWMPIDMIANTITATVALRKQIIDDIYQIMGLSDIMRGATDARETLGAQQLKTQYGSSRIRDKQYELVRLARDLVGIVSEIITEKFDDTTIIMMSQTQLPTRAMQEREVQQLQQQLASQQQQMQQLPQMPQFQQMQQTAPEQAQQIIAQGAQMIQTGQRTLEKIAGKPTFDQVMTFLRDNRAKAFTLDIETDSTIMVDENAEKERRAEFVGALGQLLPQLAQMVSANPQSAEFCGELLKFATAPFRAGRGLEGAIDELVEMTKAKADQPQSDDPVTMQNKTAKEIEAMKIEHLKEKDKLEATLKTNELQMRHKVEQDKIASQERMKGAELAARSQDDQSRAQQTNLKMIADREKHQADMIKKQADLQVASQKVGMAQAAHQAKMADTAARGDERRAAQQFKATERGFGP